jgi:hypothetical protein
MAECYDHAGIGCGVGAKDLQAMEEARHIIIGLNEF